jgi:16S rRNA G966 N2-methylase RsmD
MQYKYAIEDRDYSDFSSGRVLYGLPGHPAFPVRLASEILQRCMANREKIYADSSPCTLYDPCCGAAYHLSVLGFLHGEQIRKIIGSDVDEKAVTLARRNLGLLGLTGLNERITEIFGMLARYEKNSHKDALASADNLKNRIAALAGEQLIVTSAFQGSVFDRDTMIANVGFGTVDIVFSDVPYGKHSHWQVPNSGESADPLWLLLDALRAILSSSAIVAIASDKQQKASHENFQRIEHFQLGKRKVVFLKPV